MRYRITHKTDYQYSNPVAQSTHLVHLGPRDTKGQVVEKHDLHILPVPAIKREFFDYFGNPAVHLSIDEDHTLLSIEAQSIISVDRDQSTALSISTASWESVRESMHDAARMAEAEFCCYSRFTKPTAEIAAWGARSFTPGRPLLDAVNDLTSRIFHDFDYDGTVTDASSPVTQVFELKGGVCQDFAHLQLACLRALGLPARYVSGYLRTYPPEGQPRLIGADASHAWISVWCPELGWIDFDPTNNKMIADEHVTLCIGRDFEDISPISVSFWAAATILWMCRLTSCPSMPMVMRWDNPWPQQPAQTSSNTQAAQMSGPQNTARETASQRPDTARMREQTQNQPATQEQNHPAILPLPADRTY